ncbi:uncharacterized protein LOC111018844 [Momordica charantia]|uniref:Uncharacterized protein LOC111018844 n=1 Tax=Momordica charantia TaxID=3673 RepID=A0A6J1DB34_MOMCH|nr:uncharacterized protein LOC111018844 [Momordica charantia]
MQTTPPFTPIRPSSGSHASIFFNPLLNFTISNPTVPQKSPIFSSLVAISNGLQPQTLIVYARKKKRRAGFQRSTKLVLELASLLASNLKILPPPLDLVVAELSGGDGSGGGAGLWRGFGGGGYDGWRGKRKKTALLIGFLIVCGLALLFFTELEIDAVCGILGFALFSVALIQLWQKSLGFLLFGILIALGLRRSEVQKWVGKLGIYSPKMKSLRRKIKGKKVF